VHVTAGLDVRQEWLERRLLTRMRFDAAIDAGIVCVGEEITAILWVQDEA
jgi:hypothetical protein